MEAAGADARKQRIDIALAEFSALRAEILAHTNVQASLIALVVTAIGIVAGFVIKDDGDPSLLLILPFLVSAAGIHSSEQGRAIALIGSYIRDELWPYLEAQLGSSDLPPSWETLVSDLRSCSKHRRRRVFLTYVLLSGVPGFLVFGLGSLVPLIVLPVVDGLDETIYWWVWALGILLTLVYGVLARSAWYLGAPLSTNLRGYD